MEFTLTVVGGRGWGGRGESISLVCGVVSGCVSMHACSATICMAGQQSSNAIKKQLQLYLAERTNSLVWGSLHLSPTQGCHQFGRVGREGGIDKRCLWGGVCKGVGRYWWMEWGMGIDI